MESSEKNYIKWQVPEYRNPKRSQRWYLIAAIIILFLLFSSFFTISNWRLTFLGYKSNFLFVLIIIITVIIYFINEKQSPLMVDIKLDSQGIQIGSRFYPYQEIKNFVIIYRPKESIKNLYLNFTSSVKPILNIPLRSLDPLTVRNYLLKYLEEDYDRTSPPLSEQLSRWLKL